MHRSVTSHSHLYANAHIRINKRKKQIHRRFIFTERLLRRFFFLSILFFCFSVYLSTFHAQYTIGIQFTLMQDYASFIFFYVDDSTQIGCGDSIRIDEFDFRKNSSNI